MPYSRLIALAVLIIASPFAAFADTRPGDPARGEQVYQECALRHSVQEHVIGPKHCGVVGRKSASLPAFEYSEAMKRAGVTWDETTLNTYLADPVAMAPGTAMGFVGLPEEQHRRDVIAYLKKAVDLAVCGKKQG